MLLHEVQLKLIDSIDIKNANDEVLKLTLKLTELDYLKYFGDKEIEMCEDFFINLCSSFGIDCKIHHVKYNTKMFDSYYELFIEYKIPNDIKKLTLK